MLDDHKEPDKRSYFVDINSNSIDLPSLKKIINKIPQIVHTKLSLLNFFRDIHKRINQGFSQEQILELVFDSLNDIIPFDRIGIAQLEKNDTFIRLNWVQSKIQVKHLKKNYAVALADTSLGEVLRSQTPRILNDLDAYYRLHPRSHSTKLAILDGIQSSLTCPLIVRGKVTGVIFFSSAKKNTYKELHVDSFCEIAESLALVTGQDKLEKDFSALNLKEKIFHETLHDLNNPLAVIKGTVEMIQKKPWYPDLSKEAKRAVDTLDRNTNAMMNLIRDTVYQNRDDGDLNAISGANCLLEDFLSELKTDFEMMARAKDIKIEVQINSTLPQIVTFDAFKIKEALLNYVSNAIKFSYENSVITFQVNYRADDKKLYFQVIDHGQGIPESEHYKLFTEYGTTVVKPTSGEPSLGLGLSNVKKLVRSQDGNVFFESKEGFGSNFGLWLPVSGEAQ